MKLSIDFWEVISLLLSFVGLMFAAGKLLLAQIEKRLNERFEALEAALRISGQHGRYGGERRHG